MKISEMDNPHGYGVRARKLWEANWEAVGAAVEAAEAAQAEAELDDEPELG